MELGYAMLANAAELSGGKLYILGGDFDQLFAQFPHTLYHMDVVGKITFKQDECGRRYHLTVRLETPDGTLMEPKLEQDITPPPRPEPELGTGITFLFSVSGLVLAQPGRYHVRILLDGRELKDLWLHAQEIAAPASNDP